MKAFALALDLWTTLLLLVFAFHFILRHFHIAHEEEALKEIVRRRDSEINAHEWQQKPKEDFPKNVWHRMDAGKWQLHQGID